MDDRQLSFQGDGGKLRGRAPSAGSVRPIFPALPLSADGAALRFKRGRGGLALVHDCLLCVRIVLVLQRAGTLPFVLHGFELLAAALAPASGILAAVWARRTSKPARIQLMARPISEHDVAHAVRAAPVLALGKLHLPLCTPAHTAVLFSWRITEMQETSKEHVACHALPSK